MAPDQRKAITHWRDSAKRDLATARDLIKLKHYHWALFIYHLAIEKMFKANLINVGITPPYTHKLQRLASLAKLPLLNKYRPWLKEITSFNLEARYDSEKLEFYHKATASYANRWATQCEEVYQWLQKQLD